MRRPLLVFLLLGALLVSHPPKVSAQDSDTTSLNLQQTIEQFERTDAELAQATKELKGAAPTPSERRRLEVQIRQLQARQEELLTRLERLVGPLPPIVRSEPRAPSEEQLKTLERRQDTVLESK